MRGDALFDFLMARWEVTAPEDRPKVFRELCAEASAAYAGDAAAALFIGRFVGAALQVFPDIEDKERSALLALARKAVDRSEINVADEDVDDEDDRAPTQEAELRKKRKEAKAEREAVIKEFNSRYAVVREGGSAFVFDDCYDAVLKRQYYDRVKPSAMGVLYASRSVTTRIDDEGKRHTQPVWKYWMGHKDRRTFINGTTLMPNGKVREGWLNLWRGFAFEPRRGSWEKFKSHTREVICSGNETWFNYVMGWMATMIQHPEKPAGVALVLYSPELGVGKGTFGHALRRLLGRHGLYINNSKHLVGNFNEHLRDCVFLFADEAFFAGDKPNIGVLKGLVTDEVITIEPKHVNAAQCANMLHVLMASNEPWVVPAARGERRYFVLEIPATKKGDYAWFRAIDAEMENGGFEAMLYELMNYDLSAFNIREVPDTEALADQKNRSLSTEFAWLREVIERGYVFESELGLHDEMHTWMDVVSLPLLYASYRRFARDAKERRPLSQGKLSEFLERELKWTAGRTRKPLILGERHKFGFTPAVVKSESMQRCHKVGTLKEAAKAFVAATGVSLLVDEDELPNFDGGEAPPAGGVVVPYPGVTIDDDPDRRWNLEEEFRR